MTPEIFSRWYGNTILNSYHHQIVSYTKIYFFFWAIYSYKLELPVLVCGVLLPAHVYGVLLSLSLSNWYPGSGVVLDCFDS